jgi:RNA polymerase-binding transcription factor DksA
VSDSYESAGPPSADGEPAVRERLADAREAACARIVALSQEYESIVEANALVAIDDEHDPEGSSTAFERAHVSALLGQARDHLTAVDEALERLEQGAYGQCRICGEPIAPERLAVLPAASTCVRCAGTPTR